ncbi:molybdopterin molybdotransferase MoeA [Neosynechococcus sphagnicola]|uniref:molybdopterin molybdotransferase MoeA n=1 Tax=Neosynechococcus sphagnicola TaxID=1501145 RepID=UPI000A46E57D
MLSVQQAEAMILGLVHPLDPASASEMLNLTNATGRILAEKAISQLDFPHWDNSAMDGYAVRFADVQTTNADHPVTLEMVEEIPAGKLPTRTLQPGQCARIFTGAMLPLGADTIVIQEHTQRQGQVVQILQTPRPQAFVRYQGSYCRQGDCLVSVGTQLTAPDLAVLAAAQCAQVSVFRRPRVAIFSTGNELVSLNQTLQPGQIVDSNQIALAALVNQSGAEPIPPGNCAR